MENKVTSIAKTTALGTVTNLGCVANSVLSVDYGYDYAIPSVDTTALFGVRFVYPGVSLPSVKDVIFNGPATIVLWGDGTKTVVKNHGEIYDKEKALMAASLKKLLGNYTRFEKPFRPWMGEDDDS